LKYLILFHSLFHTFILYNSGIQTEQRSRMLIKHGGEKSKI